MLVLSVEPFTAEERALRDGEARADFSHVLRLGGGTIGCDARALAAWHPAYYATMKRSASASILNVSLQ